MIAKSRDNERRAYEAAQAQEKEEETTATNESSSSGDTADDPWSAIDSKVRQSNAAADRDRAGGMPIELRQYLNRPPVDRKTNPNPLKSWQTLKGEYPHVWEVARRLLSITATSVPCERLFSHAGLITTQLTVRSRLSA